MLQFTTYRKSGVPIERHLNRLALGPRTNNRVSVKGAWVCDSVLLYSWRKTNVRVCVGGEH